MKSSQGGVKLSLVVVSIIVLGVSAWFNQAGSDLTPRSTSQSAESTASD
jgi:type IV secretory pathway VirB2 component (pilin)